MPEARATTPALPGDPAGAGPSARNRSDLGLLVLRAPPGGAAEAARLAALRRVPGGPQQGLRLFCAMR
jgi:hypothetical protein